jgi:hypothetical protein
VMVLNVLVADMLTTSAAHLQAELASPTLIPVSAYAWKYFGSLLLFFAWQG